MELRNLIGLAEIALLQENYPKAPSFYEQSLALGKETGHKSSTANSLRGLGKIACRKGDFPHAKAWFTELLRCCQEINEPLGIVETFSCFMELALAQGDYHRAAVLLGAAESIRRTSGVSSSASEQEENDPQRTTLREQLGEARFEEAFNAGLALTQEEVIEFALSGYNPAVRGKSKR